MIVDDEKSVRTTMKAFLQDDGHEVHTAGDAEGALKLAGEHDFDVVVTDILLPKVSGVDLLRRIHVSSPDIQAIVITGKPTIDSASEVVRAGAFDYLTKPIFKDDIIRVVTNAAQVKALNDEKKLLEEENRRYQEHLEELVDERTRALRDSEDQYRRVVENASEAIFVVQDDVMKFLNPKTTEIMGRSRERLLSKPFRVLVHQDDRDMVIDRNSGSLSGEESVDTYPFRITDEGGNERWVEISTIGIIWNNRPATLNFLSDITDRINSQRRMEEANSELARANEKLVEANEIKNEFISILSHELGTPIAVMKGNLQLLSKGVFGELNEQQGSRIERLMSNAKRLDLLRRNTLDLARMDLQKMELNIEPVLFNSVIVDSLEDMQKLADEKNQQINVELPDVEAIFCDRIRMRQVLDNYLSNAIRYTEKGGKITIGGVVELDENTGKEELIVWVKDNGRGISSSEFGKVFDRFYRARPRVKGSNGLGLAIVKGIVESHIGRVWCESDGEGKGSTFFFSIPKNGYPNT